MKKTVFGLGALALVLIIAASSTAQVRGLITGRDIRNNSVTSADIRNNTVRSGDIRNGTIIARDLKRSLLNSLRGRRGPRGAPGQAGFAGPAGPAGPAGAKGDKGDAGASALNPVPSGQTIQGVIGLDVHAGSTSDWGVLMTMPMAASAVLGDDDVHIAHLAPLSGEGSEEQAACTGTVAGPTAPAGHVCIYVQESTNAAGLLGQGVNSDQGFKLKFTSPVAGDSFVDAVWAYTAP
jgi:hypothetical protein